EAKTYRFAGHSRGDARKYRERDEEQQWKELDPITRLREAILQRDPADADDLARIDAEVETELDDAVEFARNSPEPDPAEAFTDVYANPFPIASMSGDRA
ncbi:MAG: thiamine pyrophosphate-dependent enzyme, partial [Actinomycetota bacterium]